MVIRGRHTTQNGWKELLTSSPLTLTLSPRGERGQPAGCRLPPWVPRQPPTPSAACRCEMVATQVCDPRGSALPQARSRSATGALHLTPGSERACSPLAPSGSVTRVRPGVTVGRAMAGVRAARTAPRPSAVGRGRRPLRAGGRAGRFTPSSQRVCASLAPSAPVHPLVLFHKTRLDFSRN